MTCASSTPNNGVVAIKIEARLEGTCDCPHTMSRKGNTLLITAMSAIARQKDIFSGIAVALVRTTAQSAKAANPTRSTTMVKVGNSVTAMPVKKNEPPQHNDNSSSIAQVRGVIASVEAR